jgi:hypothetical protein
VAAPIILTQIFVYFSQPLAQFYFPGAGFLAASVFLVAAAAVFTRLRAQPSTVAAEPVQ